MASLKSKDVKIKIIKGLNRFDPNTTVDDWNTKTADIELTGFIKTIKLDEPEPKREVINFVGSDANGVQLQESYIDEWGTAKISGTMKVNPDSEGNYLALDELFSTKVAQNDTGTIANYVSGSEVVPDADLLLVIGDSYGVRFLLRNFKINKLNTTDIPDKGLIEVTYEFECLAGDLFKQIVKA